MSLAQRLVMRFAGKRAGEIERESRSWIVTCTTCGTQRNYWDIGGIRYKASSVGKKIWLACPTCGTRTAASVTRTTT